MSALSVLAIVFIGTAVLGAPVGLAMLSAGFAYLIVSHQDLGLVVDQTMNGLYNSYLLLAVPLFIFVANLMNASGVLERLLVFAQALVGRFRGGLAHVNVIANLIFSGMSGSAVADAAGPGLIVARMMMRDGRYPAGFAAATSVASATIGPLVPPSIAMIFYALIANASVGALFLAGIVPAALMALALMGCIAVIARRRNFPAEAPPHPGKGNLKWHSRSATSIGFRGQGMTTPSAGWKSLTNATPTAAAATASTGCRDTNRSNKSRKKSRCSSGCATATTFPSPGASR